jgi:AraC-like DNA-binding protein
MPARTLLPDFTDTVKEVIAVLLPQGHPAMRRVAGDIGISARTLQRRLDVFGLKYGLLVDEVRLETACRLFEDPRSSIGDIAAALGYSDAAHFSRAFVRWTGRTPRDFRRGKQLQCACRGSDPHDPHPT